MGTSPEPTLSVITVSAFDATRLSTTLKSLDFESSDLELTVVCPDSDLDTIRLVADFSKRVSYQVKLINDCSTGVYPAMNLGLSKASGRYVFFWNSGDLAIGLTEMKDFISWLRSSDLDWGITQAKFSWRDPQILTEANVRSYVLQQGGYVSHQAVFAKRELLMQIGGFNEKFKVASDALLITKLWLKYRYGFHNSPIVVVEFPAYSGRFNRRGRWENIKIGLETLPLRYKVVALRSAFRRELSYFMNKLKDNREGFRNRI